MEYRLGFIGGGAMAEALIAGIVETNFSSEIFVSDPNWERLDFLKERYGINSVRDNKELVKQVDLVIFAVKPQIAPKVLAEVGEYIKTNQMVLSIMAGVSMATINSYLKSSVLLIRVMPNTPCSVRAGVCAYCVNDACSLEIENFVQRLLRAVGEVVKVEEDQIDAVTGLSGSGPAYIYLVMEALIDAGVYVGLSREIAKKLVYHTVLGAAEMAIKTGKHTGELKDQVTSPGGTTIAGVRALEEGKIRSALYDCVVASVNRSRELSGEDRLIRR